MGDVAMLLPVLYAVARANPEHEFTLLTQPFFANLLLSPPSNLEAMVIETKGEERHIWGLLRYVERLSDEGFDLCLDMHDVLRTKVLRWGLALRGVKTYYLNKARQERSQLLRQSQPRDLRPLRPMWQRYLDLCLRARLRVPTKIEAIQLETSVQETSISKISPEIAKASPLVGLAPFASTLSKTYDLELMQEVVARLSHAGVSICLFGGGPQEAQILEDWAGSYAQVYNIAGKMDLMDELIFIKQLDLMLSMDSANMHLASMLGCPVLSIWCATHPSAGFLGWGQRVEDCLMSEGWTCRPCSIFGKVRHCPQGDMPCRKGLRPQQIVTQILNKLKELNEAQQTQSEPLSTSA